MSERYQLDMDQMWNPEDPQPMKHVNFTDEELDEFMDTCYAASAAAENRTHVESKEVIDFVEVSPEVGNALYRIMNRGS
jgi:hypothetical protein